MFVSGKNQIAVLKTAYEQENITSDDANKFYIDSGYGKRAILQLESFGLLKRVALGRWSITELGKEEIERLNRETSSPRSPHP